MIITIGGTPGSGKSTVAKVVAHKLKFNHYSTGDFMRQLAEEKKIDIFKFSKTAEKDRSIDEELDRRQINLGIKEDDFVIDARLGYHFIPKSIKIFIDANIDIRSQRIYDDRRGEEHNVTLENTKEQLKQREHSEALRYKKYYNLDPKDKKNYDLIIDSSQLNQDQVVVQIIDFMHKSISKRF